MFALTLIVFLTIHGMNSFPCEPKNTTSMRFPTISNEMLSYVVKCT